MKDRIKKFFSEHEQGVAIATFVAGTTAAITGFYLLKQDGSHKVTGVFSGTDVPGGTTVFVMLKNGTVLPFTKPTAE